MIAKSLSTSQRYARLQEVGGKLAEFCQALYPLLVAHADDFGRQAGDVFTVKHAVCPASPRKLDEVERALTLLHQVNLIVWYEADGRKCVQIVDFDKHQGGLHKRTRSEFPECSGKFPEIPPEGKGTEQKGREGKGTVADAPTPPPLGSVSPKPDPKTPECKVEAFVELWNQTATPPLPQCRGLSERRKAHIRARLSERAIGDWLEIFERVNRTPFLRGENDRGWIAGLDWLVASPDNVLKLLEGKYDGRPATSGKRAFGSWRPSEAS